MMLYGTATIQLHKESCTTNIAQSDDSSSSLNIPRCSLCVCCSTLYFFPLWITIQWMKCYLLVHPQWQKYTIEKWGWAFHFMTYYVLLPVVCVALFTFSTVIKYINAAREMNRAWVSYDTILSYIIVQFGVSTGHTKSRWWFPPQSAHEARKTRSAFGEEAEWEEEGNVIIATAATASKTEKRVKR